MNTKGRHKIAVMRTPMMMKTFFSPMFAIHGVSTKTKIVEMMLRVNVTPTRESPTIWKDNG